VNSSGMFRRILVETRIFVFYIYLTIFNGDNKLGSANTVLRLIAGGVGAKLLLGSANTVQKAPTGGAGLRLIAGGVGAKPLLGSVNTVQKAPTGGAGAKPLLGSANTDWC
jgi:hypothetical protein